MNTREYPHQFAITVNGIDELKVSGTAMPIEIGASSTQMITLSLRAPAEKVQRRASRIDASAGAASSDTRRV